MRSSLTVRFVGAVAACAAALAFTGEAAGMHRCLVHDGPVPAATSHSADEHAHHNESGDGTTAHGCECLGPCSASRAAEPPAAHTYLFGELAIVEAGLTTAALEHHPLSPAHTLPFSNGPPATTLS